MGKSIISKRTRDRLLDSLGRAEFGAKLNSKTNLRNFLESALEIAWRTARMPYRLPAYSVYFEQQSKPTQSPREDLPLNPFSLNETTRKSILYGGLTGLATGVCLDIAQVAGYGYLASHDHPEALLIPIVTNLLSGAYELGRRSVLKKK